MRSTGTILSNAAFALQVMLLFLLFFESSVTLPPLLQAAGRAHPLLLHLPIGFLIILGLLPLLRRELETQSFARIQSFLLYLTAFTAALTALLGFFLSREEGYSSDLLNWHKWSGVGISLLSYVLLLAGTSAPASRRLYPGVLGASLVTLVLTGHFGASLTHGENYLWEPLRGKQKPVPTEANTAFAAAVAPVLEKRCYSCHNEKKAKGKLIMTTAEGLQKGGKDGPVWLPGLPDSSQIIQRLRLPVDHDDHMPPAGKPQLTDAEIQLIHAWIADGADLKKPLSDFAPESPLRRFAEAQKASEGVAKTEPYAFKPASDKLLRELNTPFRSVTPIALGSPALQAEIFVRGTYQPEFLTGLEKAAPQLVSLNLTNLPVKDEELAVIGRLQQLERLILNGTDISGASLDQLKSCRRLRSLALSQTTVDKNIVKALKQLPALKEVFIWSTKISPEDLPAMQKELPGVAFNTGYIPDQKEILQLSPPTLENESAVLEEGEKAILKVNFPNAVIRYTTDGSDPDSLKSPVYKKPLAVDRYVILKAKVFKDGWLGSRVLESHLFRRGLMPERAELSSDPDPRYRHDGAKILIDGFKGDANAFSAPLWLGYRENPFSACFYFDEKTPPTVTHITVSYARNVGSFIVPPTEVEIWAGKDRQSLKLLKRVIPPPVEAYVPNVVLGEDIEIPPSAFACYQVIAKPVARLPKWHQGKGDKGWVFVDEVLFN